jgi:hypothetical protein
MHTAMLVIGDSPEQRARTAETMFGRPDWAAIGGRYTGSLIPIPGATTARVYGDALPNIEAAFHGWFADMDMDGVGFHRHTCGGPGVDQVRRRDLDVAATIDGFLPPIVLDADGTLHNVGLTIEETAYATAAAIQRMGIHLETSMTDADAAVIAAKDAAWGKRVTEILAGTDHGALVTVVDIHM